MAWRNKVLSALFDSSKRWFLDRPAQIERAVRRRRRVAENLGLTRGFTDFVHGYVFHIPAWFNAPSNRSAIPPIVTGAREIGHQAVELIVNGRAFAFRRCNKFRDDRDGEGIELTLQVEGQTVFEVIATVRLGWHAELCSNPYVTGFIEGPWVSDFLTMVRQQEDIHKRQLEQSRRSMAEHQKRKFGL